MMGEPEEVYSDAEEGQEFAEVEEAILDGADGDKGKGKAAAPERTPQECIAEGKKFLAKDDIGQAANCFSEALEALVAQYGELGRECVDAYYYYGMSLLKVYKLEAGCFGGDEGEEEEEGGKPSTLQLAWESLECARLIYEQATDDAAKLKLADVHYDLGEFCLETEQFPIAVEEFGKCLALREKYTQDGRLLAEVFFSLGSACQHNKQFSEALAHFDKAHEHLTRVRDELVAKGTEDAKAEAADLDAVIKDVADRKEDAKAEAAEAKRAARVQPVQQAGRALPEAGEAGEAGSAFDSPFDAPSKGKGKAGEGEAAKAPVNDLSTMVRKKTKPTPVVAAEAGAAAEAKKAKPE